MKRRAASVTLAGMESWQSAGSAAFAESTLSEGYRRSCPMTIIVRGVIVLSILVSGLGYALAHLSWRDRFSTVRADSPQFAITAALPKSIGSSPKPLQPVSLASDFQVASLHQNAQVRQSFLSLLQSALETHKKELQFGPVRVKRSIVQTIIRAARQTHTDPVLLMAIADKESSFAPDAAARSSSAMGLFQFVDSTWLKAVRRFGPQFGLAKEAAMISGAEDRPYVSDPAERRHILNLRKNPFLSAAMAAETLRYNGEKIAQKIGRGLTGGEAYLAHFLGRDDAEKFMEKVVGQPQYSAASLLPRPARANASIFYKRDSGRPRGLTVAAVHHKFEEMIGARLNRYKSIAVAAGLSAFEAKDENASDVASTQ